jgi:hypothetical protein
MAKAAPPLPASAVALQSIWSAFAVQDDGGYPLWMGALAARKRGRAARAACRPSAAALHALTCEVCALHGLPPSLPRATADADAFADFVEACPELLTEDFSFDDAMDLYDAAVAFPAGGDPSDGGGPSPTPPAPVGEPAEGLTLKSFLGVLSRMAEERYPDVDYGIAYAKLLAAHVFRVRPGAAAAAAATAAPPATQNEPPPAHKQQQQVDVVDDGDVPDSWEDDTRFLGAPAAAPPPVAAASAAAPPLRLGTDGPMAAPQPVVASQHWSTASFSLLGATTTTTSSSLGGDPAAPTAATTTSYTAAGAVSSSSSSAMMVVHAAPSAAAAAISALDAGTAFGLGGSGGLIGSGGGGAPAFGAGKPAPVRPGSPLNGSLLRLSPTRSASGGSLAAGLRPTLSPAASTAAATAAASPQLLSFGGGSAAAAAAPPSPPQAQAHVAASHALPAGWRNSGAKLALRAVFRAHARKVRDAALSDALRLWQRQCSLAREGEVRAALAASRVSERAGVVAEATASAAAAAAALAQSHLANTLAAHAGAGHYYHDASVGGGSSDDGGGLAASLMTPIKGGGAGDATATGLLQVNTSLHQHHQLMPSAPPSAMLAGRSVLLSPSALGVSRGPVETVGTQTATFGVDAASGGGSAGSSVDAGTSTTPDTVVAATPRRRCGRVRSACGWAFAQLLRLALVWGLIAGSRYIVHHRPELLVAWVGGAARARDGILAQAGGGGPLAPLLRALPRFGVDGGCVVVAGRTLRLCDPAVYRGHASAEALAEDVSFGDVMFDDIELVDVAESGDESDVVGEPPVLPAQSETAALTADGNAAASPTADAAPPALLGLAVDASSGDAYDLPPEQQQPPFLSPLFVDDADGSAGGCTNPLGCGSDEVAF